MQKWYNTTNANQKIFMFAVSICLVFVFGVGLIPLAVLLYCHLGTLPEIRLEKKNKTPAPGSPDYLAWANREGPYADDNGAARPNEISP